MNVEHDPVELTLDYKDRNSDTWARIRGHLLARLDMLRTQNDGDLPADKTARLRGQIAEIRSLIAAGETQDDHQ